MTAPGSFDAAAPAPTASPRRRRRLVLAGVVVGLGCLLGCWAVAASLHADPGSTGSSRELAPPAPVPRSGSLAAALGVSVPPWRGAVATGVLTVDREPGLAAVAPARWSTRLTQILAQARTAVERALGRPAPILVAYLPAGRAAFRTGVDTRSGGLGDIAGVTVPVDGTPSSRVSAMIVLNPGVVATLTPRAVRVVVIHEATHVATGALHATGPLWLQEGFADYVAIRAVGVPTDVAAREAINWLRGHRAPSRWPADTAFDGSAQEVRIAYELAWLGARQIAADFGERRLSVFYQQVEGGVPIASAARVVLGTSSGALTDRWQSMLAGLSGGG